jgi:hypothetical protein
MSALLACNSSAKVCGIPEGRRALVQRSFAALLITFVILCFAITSVAQSPMPPPPYGDFPATKFPEENYETRPFRRWVRPEDRVVKDGPLAPAKKDRIALAGFLREKHTGLLRLLPHVRYYDVTKPLPPSARLPGFGAYYSFVMRTHLSGFEADIGLSDDKLSVGFARAQFGFLARLGEVPLEEITLEDPRVTALAAYGPPQMEANVHEESRRLNSPEGLTLNGQVYRRSLPVEENTSYLLRSISPKRSDVLVAFRVIRKDADGSVTISWKLLKRYSTPKLQSTAKK